MVTRNLSFAAAVRACAIFAAAAGACPGTLIPPISFHEIVLQSNQIVTGRVLSSTVAWGSEHKFIWTRYTVAVDQVIKGEHQKSVTISEPGGTLDGITMRIAGAVAYLPGEHVALFLETYPGGVKRTVNWGQGKLTFDAAGKTRAGPFSELQGLTETGLRSRVQTELLARRVK